MGWHRRKGKRRPKYIGGHQPPARLGTGEKPPPEVFERDGHCVCGCGALTVVATETFPARGVYQGFPNRFLKGHNRYTGQMGDGTSRWKGGRNLSAKGYWMVYSPGHHLADVNYFVAEHRLVMEAVLGRDLEPGEVVHHLNEVRTDNRPENLVLLSKAEHDRIHRALRREKRAVQIVAAK